MRKVRKSFSAATGMSFTKNKSQRFQAPAYETRESEYVEDPEAFSPKAASQAAAAAEAPAPSSPAKSEKAAAAVEPPSSPPESEPSKMVQPPPTVASLPQADVASEVEPAGAAVEPASEAASPASTSPAAAAAAPTPAPVEAVTAKKELAKPGTAPRESFRATKHPKKHALDDHVHLSFEEGPLGINVKQGDGVLLVSKVNPNGPAAGLITEGYTISMLNDNDVESQLSLRQFKTMVQSSARPLKLSFAPQKPATDTSMDGGQRRVNRGVMAAWTCCLGDQDAQAPTQAPPTAEVTMRMSSSSAGSVATLASS